MAERGSSETYLGPAVPGAPVPDGTYLGPAVPAAPVLDGTYLGPVAVAPEATSQTVNTYLGPAPQSPSSAPSSVEETKATLPSTGTDEKTGYRPSQIATVGSEGTTMVGTVGAGSRSTVGFRTRLNDRLEEDNRVLDVSLQLSRLSIFPNIAACNTKLSETLRRRLEQLDTHGRYAVRRFLAAGGMGAVLEIDDNDFGRRTAIKIIKPGARVYPGILERFIEEARITAQLEHPNIVPIHDLGVLEDGTVFFTMKFIQGMSLGQVVKKLKEGDAATRAHWTEAELLLTFLKVLDGLGFAHSKGVVHRDIKPDNIMIDAHGEVLVVDWGIAKALAGGGDFESEEASTASTIIPVPGSEESLNATLQGTTMGSLHYMPMEQAVGDLTALDGRSDIYALGGTMFELLALQRPRTANNSHGLLALAKQGKTTPLIEAAPHLHPDLAAIVNRALATQSAERYPTCEAFAADLRRYLEGKAVAARRRSALERAAAWISVHKVPVVVASAAAVLAVVAVLAGLHWADLRNRTQAETLTGRATTLLTGTPTRPAVDEAIDLLTAAKALAVGDANIAAALERARATQADLARQEREAAQAQARVTEARTLAQRGRAHAEAGRHEDGERDLAAAFQLTPSDVAIDTDLRAVRRILDDRAQAVLRAAAQVQLDEGRQATVRARASHAAGDAAGTDREVSAAAAAFTLAAKDGVAPGNLPEAVAALATFRQAVTESRSRAAAVQAAITAAGQAVETARAAESERAQSARTHAEAVAVVTRLTRDLASAPLAAKAPLWAAHQTQRSAAETEAAADTRLENHALAAWNGLAALADHPLRATAAALLADAYQRRAAEAEAREDEAGIRTNRAALRRFDDGSRAATLDAPVLLTMAGPAARITVRRLAPGPDTRLAPVGDPVTTLVVPGTLPLVGGRYQLEADGTVVALYVRPGRPVTMSWPGRAPTVPGVAFAWVAQPGGGFWLSTTEITHEQYRAFVLDPATRALALDPVAALRRGEDAELLMIPRTSARVGVWTPVPANGAPTDLIIPVALAFTPVTNVTRDDALAYAAWVSISARVRARLPTAAEWEYAATAGDPARTWPWGGVFDGAFAMTAQSRRNQPAPVTEITHDIGPFGHVGLAGNVREWLAPDTDEGVGELTGAVAGGSWGDDRPEAFAGRMRERVPADVLTPAIGFRLVVEATP